MSDKTPSVHSKQSERKISFAKQLGMTACGIAGIAFSAASALAAFAADGSPMPITDISVDGQRQLVVKFDTHGGGFPTVPHLLDLPGPNHRVVVDFAGAAIEKGSVLSAEELSTAVTKALPACHAVRYSNLANVARPTARIVLDLPQTLKAEPRVVKVEESSVVIDLGDAIATAEAPSATAAAAANDPASAPAAAETPAAPAVNEAAATAPAASAEPVAAAPVPAPGSKANGSWDWSGSGQAPTAAAETITAPATQPQQIAQANVAPAADTIDGVAPGAAAVQIAAQPEAAELRPAISDTTAARAATVSTTTAIEPGTTADAPLSSLPATPAATPTAAAITDPSPAGIQAAVRLYNSAVKNHLNGKLSDAITDYKGALAANPMLSEAHSNLGLIYNQQHDYTNALSEFRKALAINPKDAITYNGIGAALRAQRDLAGAIKNWQTAVSLDSHLATAHYNLGTAYEIQRDYDRALDSYKDAVKNDYRLGEAYYRMGLIMERKHNFADATAQFKEALKVSNDAEYSKDAQQRVDFLAKTRSSVAERLK